MRKLFAIFIIFFLTIAPSYCEGDAFVPDESVLETPVFESEVEKNEIPDISKPQDIKTKNTKISDKIVKNIHDVYELQIENTDLPSCLLKEQLTQHFERGPVDNIHYWAGVKLSLSETINDSVSTNFNVSLINAFIDGTFKGEKEHFRIMLDPTPAPSIPMIQQLFQDLYIDTHRIKNHRILIGNTRPGVGYEGAGSSYTLPFASRSQISRNFGTARKLGIRVMGNYSLLEYDLGGYSSGTNFSSFFPGAEFDGWVNLKPLGKTDGKYGKLTVGGGIATGSRDSRNFTVLGAYIGYKYKNIWARAEFANADGSNGLSGFTTKQRQGWYATVGYKINKKLEVVARYDEFDPDKNISNNNIKEYSAGINYYIKGQALKLLLNYVFCQNPATQDSHKIILGMQIAI